MKRLLGWVCAALAAVVLCGVLLWGTTGCEGTASALPTVAPCQDDEVGDDERDGPPGQTYPLIITTEGWILTNEMEGNLSKLWVYHKWSSGVTTTLKWCDTEANPAWSAEELGVYLTVNSSPPGVHSVPMSRYESTGTSGEFARETDWHNYKTSHGVDPWSSADAKCHWHSSANTPSSGDSFIFEGIPLEWTSDSPACSVACDSPAEYEYGLGDYDCFTLHNYKITWNYVHSTMHDYRAQYLYICYTDKDNVEHWCLQEELPSRNRIEFDKKKVYSGLLPHSQRPADKVWHCQLVIGRDPTKATPNNVKHVSCNFTVTAP